MMFSNVWESVVEVMGMTGVICGGKETKVSQVTCEDLPCSSFFESSSPMITFASVLDTFTRM